MHTLKKIILHFHQFTPRGRRNLVALPVGFVLFLVTMIWEILYLPSELIWPMVMIWIMFLVFWTLLAWETIHQVNTYIESHAGEKPA